MTVHIRPYHPSDIPHLYEICLKTGDNGQDASHLFESPYLIGDYYAVPYAIYEPELTFVLVKDGRPVGYVLGASNTPVFEQWMFDEWFPPLREKYPQADPNAVDMRSHILKSIHKTVCEPDNVPGYPAHLHIDILPEGQGGGWGLKLMERFWDQLRSMEVPAVHLGVSKANANAVGFYKHIGYHVITEHQWGYMLGKRLIG